MTILFQRMATQICNGLADGLGYAYRNIIVPHEEMARDFPLMIEVPTLPAPTTPTPPTPTPKLPAVPTPIETPADIAHAMQMHHHRCVKARQGNVLHVDLHR